MLEECELCWLYYVLSAGVGLTMGMKILWNLIKHQPRQSIECLSSCLFSRTQSYLKAQMSFFACLLASPPPPPPPPQKNKKKQTYQVGIN